jgi:hypothetical protein
MTGRRDGTTALDAVRSVLTRPESPLVCAELASRVLMLQQAASADLES